MKWYWQVGWEALLAPPDWCILWFSEKYLRRFVENHPADKSQNDAGDEDDPHRRQNKNDGCDCDYEPDHLSAVHYSSS